MKKRHLILLLMVSTIFGCSRHSFPTKTTPPAASTTLIDGRYEARLLETAAGPLPYRVAHLNPDSLPGKPALVLYLHSANGRGADNISQFQRQRAIDSICNYMVAHRMNVLFLIPQCPVDHHWSGNRNLPSYLGPVKELLKLYADSTDRQQAYLFGASMGGGGVWRLLNECPNTFAAAFVASGMYRNFDPKNVAKTPLYVTLGGAEDDKPRADFPAIVEVVRAAGGEVMFDIIPGLNHSQTCEQSFTTERIGWVFGHERK
jgi:predicted peptidase